MPLIGIPNVSEGRDAGRVRALTDALSQGGASVLDVHRDAVHGRSVFTMTAERARLPVAVASLARASSGIDLTLQRGVHPRLGALDVCPIVPHEAGMEEAIETAQLTGEAVARDAGLPVYFYARNATRREAGDLAGLRRGGLEALIRRAEGGFLPDLGPRSIDPRRGVVCVGARDVLVAFNVWLQGELATARAIAARIRGSAGGLPGVKALGFEMGDGKSQVSTNLTQPLEAGIDRTFEAVARLARTDRATVLATEIVGLVPSRFLPDPDGEAARLLLEPGRSLETVLGRTTGSS
ncbi:MAG: glutamate formiminotransferase [Actinomycetota bacterium]